MANVIIGIHGLGNKPPKKILEKWWKLAMIEGLKSNNYNLTLPNFKLVYWTDIMYDEVQSLWEKDSNSPRFLREKYVEANENFVVEDPGIRKKIVDFVSEQMSRILLNKDLSLNYSFISDAIVKNFFHDLEIYYKEDCTDENKKLCKAKDRIRGRLIKILKKHKSDNILLISHSMGSIIAFDVLSSASFNIPIHTFVTAGSPLGFPVVMSKIAAEQKQKLPLETNMLTPPTITKNWYNFSDIHDKVALNYKLADDFTKNKLGVLPVDFLVVNNYEINGKRNPHKSYGYLRTPEFSKILSEFIKIEKPSIRHKLIKNLLSIRNIAKSILRKNN